MKPAECSASGAVKMRPVPEGATLRVIGGFFEGLELAIDRDWLVIGRGLSVEFVLCEPTLSRAHAAVGYDGTRFFVRDLDSTNGTLVNGERCDEQPLNDGDEIQIGRMSLRVGLPKQEADAA